jgi:hypothetical protein
LVKLLQVQVVAKVQEWMSAQRNTQYINHPTKKKKLSSTGRTPLSNGQLKVVVAQMGGRSDDEMESERRD